MPAFAVSVASPNFSMRFTIWTIALIVPTGIAVGQQKGSRPVKVVTVCEILGDVNRYADTAVAVVGRLELSISLIDQSEFLSQDACKRPVVTHGHTWLNKIQLWTDWEDGMPKPPAETPNLQRSVISAKLAAVRKNTRLGVHEEPRFKAEGGRIVYSGRVDVANEWAIVYGRIVRMPKLDEDCGEGGCGGDNVPLLIIAEPYNVRRLRDDGTLLPSDQ